MKLKINGPVISIITPFSKNLSIDYKSLKKMLNFYYKRGAKNFYLMAFNSRLGLLTEKETLELNKFTIQYIKKKFKNSKIIAAEKLEGSTQHTINFCNKIEKFKPDAISLIFGEKFYNEDQVFSHFNEINKKTNSKLLLHLQDMTNGMSHDPPTQKYSLNLINRICSLKSFVAIKEDAKNDEYTKKIIKKVNNKVTIIKSGGGMKSFSYFINKGCPSWLVGLECIDPKISVDFYNALRNGDKNFCNFIINSVEKPFFKIVYKYGWHLVIKSCLSFVNLMKSDERLPLKKLKNNQEQEIFSFLRSAKKACKIKLKKNYFVNAN